MPLAERHRVREWSAADHCHRRFDIRTAIEQRIQDFDVVTAGGSVKRCFRMWSIKARVAIGAGIDQHRDRGSGVRKVSGPIRRDMQERASVCSWLASARPAADSGRCRSG
jgi:hypothetical protein